MVTAVKVRDKSRRQHGEHDRGPRGVVKRYFAGPSEGSRREHAADGARREPGSARCRRPVQRRLRNGCPSSVSSGCVFRSSRSTRRTRMPTASASPPGSSC